MIFSRGNTAALPALRLVVVLAGVLTACGQSPSPSGADVAKTGQTDQPAVSRVPDEEPAGSSAGSVVFAVNGEAKSFDYLPKSGCAYNPLASTVKALPEAGSTESFAITFMAIDLKKLGYPADLPLPKDPSRPMSAMAAMATVGFGYIDGNGNEWAGPGSIHIDSFDNSGVVRGTFDEVKLPHTDEKLPDITLTGGAFSARITSPW